MALKTFNIDAEVYGEFSRHCKENGISMSKKIEKFIKEELESLKGSLGVRSKVSEIEESKKEHPFGKYC